jgi:hypothetical protein
MHFHECSFFLDHLESGTELVPTGTNVETSQKYIFIMNACLLDYPESGTELVPIRYQLDTNLITLTENNCQLSLCIF